jgi:hypothetical protein
MDPNATLRDLTNAIEDGDHDDAIEHADNLLAWLDGGGFVPSALGLFREQAVDKVNALRARAIRAGGLPADVRRA